jgi:putative PIN family toxin of toxin-antitoxin system
MTRVFIDTSVFFAALYSTTGAAHDLLQLAVRKKAELVVSRIVLEEVERNLSEKAPHRAALLSVMINILEPEVVPDPSVEEVLVVAQYVALKDAPIVAAAIAAGVDYLVTYDRKHLLDPAEVTEKSGLRIVTPNVVVDLLEPPPPEE